MGPPEKRAAGWEPAAGRSGPGEGQLHIQDTTRRARRKRQLPDWGRVPREVAEDKRLSPGAVRCYILLSCFKRARKGDGLYGLAWPTEDKLATRLKAPKRSVRRWIGELESAGWVTSTKRREVGLRGHPDSRAYNVHESLGPTPGLDRELRDGVPDLQEQEEVTADLLSREEVVTGVLLGGQDRPPTPREEEVTADLLLNERTARNGRGDQMGTDHGTDQRQHTNFVREPTTPEPSQFSDLARVAEAFVTQGGQLTEGAARSLQEASRRFGAERVLAAIEQQEETVSVGMIWLWLGRVRLPAEASA